ncbi:hypothetical protein Q9R19_00510 [Microbacterium sp. ARD32]|uniref:hypothetical protein n=1 Tax=Microbacterium sp. ARD32 TaxID=2962577 RepID=UPI0028822990|nr:hypothetical protein [Microbacterium sp. ARD32]MDT0156102.1 hypothetical protein [Microbacterium sp. ARD32]
MATVHPRIQVTPNDDLMAALERAAERWPDASRSELMLRLALEGDRSGIERHARVAVERAREIDALRALVGDLYDPNELEQLRGEWRA